MIRSAKEIEDVNYIKILEDAVQKGDKKGFKVGVKQAQKALDMDFAHSVYVARDAQQYVLRYVIETANKKQIPVYWIDSMQKLGSLCKIDVGAAIAVVTK